VPFLPVRDEFHSKRNQARQKLATLPDNRFKDLAADVFFELEVRYPAVLETPPKVTTDEANRGLEPLKVSSLNGNPNPNSVKPRSPRSPGANQSPQPEKLRSNVAPSPTRVDLPASEVGSDGGAVNFQSLDALMADLGSLMVKEVCCYYACVAFIR
jgi:hypothetical protein